MFTEINIRDYRAWYGLGQIYELVKLPNYALFYFTHARDLRPRDYRMLVSLGEMFDRADRIFESMACFYKALFYDTDGTIMLKLAKYVTHNLFTICLSMCVILIKYVYNCIESYHYNYILI